MELLFALWYVLLFVICFFAYLSFSIVTHDVLGRMAEPIQHHAEEGFKLRPLTPLFESEEKLIAVLQFCRLLFALPVILLFFEWVAEINLPAAIITLLLLFPLLYLLPVWVAKPASRKIFRVTVQAISYVLYPALWLLDKLSGEVVPPEIQEPEKKKTNGELEEVESQEFKGDIIKAISTIENTTVREVMTPRVDMVTISSLATFEELHQFFKEHKFSRVPVYKERVDNIVGIVGVMDFVSRIPETNSGETVDAIMRPALFVPETKKVFTLLREFRESHAQMAIVIDEYGGTSGLVTLEDLLEEIVGEIADEFDEAPEEAYREKDGAYVVTGKFPIERLEEVFEIQVQDEDFETISGLIFSIVGRIPLVGEMVKFKNLDLEILEADKRRIHRVRIRQTPVIEENTEAAETKT
jgi:CBS domain containing-hemolysin-like protein